ncbi:ATP-binding cassette domain-containing protein [Erwinia sp. E602]|uniref:amino acid ABC transporter ATP-binding protein n=1 Tax=unclassified Erwinia TaxID=2622719 RepID=UPI0006F8EC23|nr:MULTISPECIES: amino acid ABC transporter ATP-binding protein [unclassified Erwinia]KQN56578.1 ATP-binding protein [Erwinia sp. Leaf53]PLV61335.1 ATP-binding protein [Erwinia sp. B116]QUG76207.1 ATP-binding cassette domain-containing protein [Erwinia sp. E602]
MSHPLLTISQLHKRFGDHHVLKGVDLTVNAGDRIAIIGGSGSGKSTLLRCLNFMELPSAGEITLDGRLIGKALPPAGNGEKRVQYSEAELCEVRKKIGMVFQQFNLFPQMTVLQNVMEGLVQVKRLKKARAQEIALAELNKVGLGDKAQAYPGRLSGGQQQRVAIARALAMQPEIMLFDEPTSSLDPELVGEVLTSIRSLADEGRTLLLVTHELGFAYHFASRVIFFADGEFYESGTPDEVLKHPQRPKTRAFIDRFTTFSF